MCYQPARGAVQVPLLKLSPVSPLAASPFLTHTSRVSDQLVSVYMITFVYLRSKLFWAYTNGQMLSYRL